MSEAAAPAGISRLFSDDLLTRRAVGGDERAFAAIFRRYHQSLYRFCLAIVGNSEDAQDALQNTMIKVLRALPGEEREIDLKPWLYRIAHNESVDLLRRRRETRQLDVEQIAPGYGLAEDAATRERLRRLLADLEELPERQREVLVLRELGGLGFEEIGSALGTSAAVARQTLYEARQSLQQMEGGREMTCEAVTRALSDGDGRVARRRDVRAHLRACPECRRFREEIVSRHRDFAALAPLPGVAAAGMLQGLLGGSHGATGGSLAAALGGGAAKSVGASALAKGVATVAVVAAIGVTAADRSGVIQLGLPGDRGKTAQEATPGTPVSEHASSAAGPVKVGGATGHSQGTRAAAGNAGHRASPALAVKPGNAQSHGGQKQGIENEHPHGRDHEKQLPSRATKGQETAAAHQPSGEEQGGGGNGAAGGEHGDAHAATPAQPSHPAPPSSPPAEAPDSQPSGPPAESPSRASEGTARAPEGAPGATVAEEKIP
jgi:RNA polymerase sigma factor (sigma-70 family)